MGIVYQAHQVSLNRRVALQVLGPALTQASDLARFQREAQAVSRLKHPGIATLYFVGQDAELCYRVMELVEGIPLCTR
jgi:serine/threonine protein kinase